MAWAGNPETIPGPFTFRGCDLTAEFLPATEGVRVQLPATAPLFERLSVSTRPSFQNSAGGRAQAPPGSTEAACHSSGSWQTSNALALQARLCGRDTHRLHHFISLRE